MNLLGFVLLVALLLLVGMLFLMALIEASLLHSRRSAVATRADAGDHRAQRLLRLLDDLPRVMNAVLLAVLLCQVSATTISGALARRWFGSSAATATAVVVTMVLFVYGEAIPKTIAIRRPTEFATRLVTPTSVVATILRPFVSLLVWIADLQMPRPGALDTDPGVDEDELLHLTDEAAAAGRIERSDAELVERSFSVGDRRAGQIMVSRHDVVTVRATVSVDEALRTAIGVGHRRLPVVDDHSGAIIGVVRLRDLAHAATTDPVSDITDHMRDTFSVPESQRAIEVLRHMQSSGEHLAVVTDEESVAFVGILTIEDIVEELVGTIEEPERR